MDIHLALAHVVDSRTDFFEVRRPLVDEALQAAAWLREEFACVESGLLQSAAQVREFARAARGRAQALIIHVPIWADPVFAVKLARLLPGPVLLLGNSRPETSSLVGLLGAGGALDQAGLRHRRVFDHPAEPARNAVRAFARAAAALDALRGQTLGLFGGRSLGIVTAAADPAQWQRLFGVDIEMLDQAEIRQAAEALPAAPVARHVNWLAGRVGAVRFGGAFTPLALERQVRSYLATRQLAAQHGFDFVGVKCQPEMSDGYVTQCVAHLLANGAEDADGPKPAQVHACESDADGALTMQILHLLSGQPAGLLDIRWYDPARRLWALANCGALPAALCATPADPGGLAALSLTPHVFGRGGGGALSGAVTPQPVTLARLCRRDGEYWMAIVSGAVEAAPADLAGRITPAFPKAFVRSAAGADFLAEFGSNHIHMVSGDWSEALIAFCDLAGLAWKRWA